MLLWRSFAKNKMNMHYSVRWLQNIKEFNFRNDNFVFDLLSFYMILMTMETHQFDGKQ